MGDRIIFSCYGMVFSDGILFLLLKVSEFQLGALSELSEEFGVESLVVQCEQMKDALKDTPLRKDHKLELLHSSPVTFLRNCPTFSYDLPIDVQKLKNLLETGKYSDVDVYIEGHGLVVQAHKLVLSVWSAPFAKVIFSTCLP